MIREDAIKTLKELWRETNDPWYEEVYNMAINALEADCKTEPQTEVINDSSILVKDLVDDEFNPYDEECMRCKHLKLKCEFVPSYCRYEPKDEPTTQTETQNSNKNSNVILVYDGVSEAVRCAMCSNPNKSDRGCDGACSYDEKLYERIMKAIAESVAEDEPQTRLTAKCLECNNSKTCKENHWEGCKYEPLGCEVTAVVGTIKDEPQTMRDENYIYAYDKTHGEWYPIQEIDRSCDNCQEWDCYGCDYKQVKRSNK